jgi:hypothetical protein
VGSWREHSKTTVARLGVSLIRVWKQEIALVLINFKMQFNRLKWVMVGVVITHARLKAELYLGPTFAYPAIGIML